MLSMVMIVIKYLEINRISVLSSPYGVVMPLNINQTDSCR